MSYRIALVGHCGGDGSYLRSVIRKAVKDAVVLDIDGPRELQDEMLKGLDLLLFNRELSYGFPQDLGVEAIRDLKRTHPSQKMMLVSNYPEAQADAVAAGALPGFGKRELGSPRVIELLRAALAEETAPASKREG